MREKGENLPSFFANYDNIPEQVLICEVDASSYILDIQCLRTELTQTALTLNSLCLFNYTSFRCVRTKCFEAES